MINNDYSYLNEQRTYRAVAEMYAFLPREAVTRFLMSCKDCQKRMHLSANSTFPVKNSSPSKAIRKSSSTNLNELLKTASLDASTLTSLANNLIANTGGLANNNCILDGKSNVETIGVRPTSLATDLSNGNKSTNVLNKNKELAFSPITTAYLKQIDLFNKTRSMLIGQNLNGLLCNNYPIDSSIRNHSLENLQSNDKDLLNDQESNSLYSVDEDDSLINNLVDHSDKDSVDKTSTIGQMIEKADDRHSERHLDGLLDRHSDRHLDGHLDRHLSRHLDEQTSHITHKRKSIDALENESKRFRIENSDEEIDYQDDESEQYKDEEGKMLFSSF